MGDGMYERVFKRLLDIVICSIAAVLLIPVYLAAAIGIKLSSKGPILYVSERAGQGKKPFRFYKFRSMHLSSEDKHLCVADADRVFPWGKVMRRLKIDELPQLFNVIRGDMSIVGPRPLMMHSVDKFYSGKYAPVLTVKPGLTSAASLYDYTVGDTYRDDKAYRAEVVPVRMEMELLYVKKQSFVYDTALFLRTILTVLAVLAGKKTFRELPEYKEIKRTTR